MTTEGNQAYIDSLKLNQLTLTGGSTGDVLVNNNGNCTWTSNIVDSFNSRSGAVVPLSGDYSITQITNASSLANSANVNTGGAFINNYLYYSGTQWTNKIPNFYVDTIGYNGISFTPYFNVIYSAPNCTITMPSPTMSDIGKRIIISTCCGAGCYINFPTGVFLKNQTNFTMSGNQGCAEFIAVTATQYDLVGDGNFVDANNKPFNVKNLGDLANVNFPATPFNNDIIKYDSGTATWSNSRLFADTFLNSNGDLNANQYIQQCGQTFDLHTGSISFAKACVISSLYISLSAAPGAGKSRLFTVCVNGSTPGFTVYISGLDTTGYTTVALNLNQFDTIQVINTTPNGTPASASAIGVISYYYC